MSAYRSKRGGARASDITPAQISDLKSRVRLSSLIGETVALRRNGDEYVALCPFHVENTPSFTVVDAKGFFHCFGCPAHGDAIEQDRGDWSGRHRSSRTRPSRRSSTTRRDEAIIASALADAERLTG